MQDGANHVIDARLSEALGAYFNGVSLLKTVGDCALLSGVRKQNGAPVTIYTASFNAARDEAVVAALGKAFATFEKTGCPQLEAPERLLTSRAFRKSPAMAVLACPVPVFDEAFDTLDIDGRLALIGTILDGLTALHRVGLVHGNLSPDVVRREQPGGAVRLTEPIFVGDRPTTLLHQPPAYQSRHVINTATPRTEDDVHAAGMLAYRILLGPDGAARALTGGPAEPEQITAAILGEGREPPGPDALFPEGHPKADQVARLLARMTGRMSNAQPYTSAEAARRAFETVLSGHEAPSLAATMELPAGQTAPAAPPRPVARKGVSAATAVTIFAGFLVSTAAASYLYLENGELATERDVLARNLGQVQANAAALSEAHGALRAADRTIATAQASGAARASDDADAAVSEAVALLAQADGEMPGDAAEATQVAVAAGDRAGQALELLAEMQELVAILQSDVETAHGVAATAAGPQTTLLGDPVALLEEGRASWQSGALSVAGQQWEEALDRFATVTEALRADAEAARQTLDGIDTAASSPGAILGASYASRADAAYETGRYAEAISLYQAALTAFGATPEVARAAGNAAPRAVTVGDGPDALAAALQLCIDAAPIDPARCPSARPAGETAREADLRPYSLDATEVSAAAFRRFVEAEGYRTIAETEGQVIALTSSGEARMISADYTWATPEGAGSSIDAQPDRPVTNIALADAMAYCAWAGGRLPTEAEWEASARAGTDRAFPWGAWDPSAPVWRGATDAVRRLPMSVGEAGGAGPEGHQGLSGNAREWVLTPDGAVLKGGSWNTANPADLRISAQLIVPGNAPGIDFGFRCATDLEEWP